MKPLYSLLIAGSIVANLNIAFAEGLRPEEAIKKMKVADDLEVKIVASEPMVRQPVCIEFDDRGRLWVIQYLQYPNPAGLKRAKVDRYSRTVYDKVPEPPPRGPKGADRITILDDFDETGRARSAKDFISDLNLASGLASGHGGVFILQVPYLLFYPDRNRDDVPDGDPEVCLTGFGMEDAHSVANSLTWGPDGWLYGCQGSTVTANIRGIEFQQGVWRYHPVSKRFELFCEGGGNSWGMDFDEDGNLIYVTNHGGFRGLHAVQGGYYWKSFAKHGGLHNPYTYGYFDHMPHDNFIGGHVTVGARFLRGSSLPDRYQNAYAHVDTLAHGVQWTTIQPLGSTFQSKHGGQILEANDNWFAPTDLTVSRDGTVYICDWYDQRTAHPDPDADWDRSNGRIYRIQGKGTQSEVQDPNQAIIDISVLTSKELIENLEPYDIYWTPRARRALAERRDVSVYPQLRALIFETKTKNQALEALWALYGSGGCEESFLNDLLKHKLPQIRKWAVRFLGDEPQLSETSLEGLVKLAATEPDVLVRSQLACTAKRLPPKPGMIIAHALAARDLDAKDPHIPLLLWWAVEKHAVAAINGTLELFGGKETWNSTISRETILPRLIRRYAAEGTKQTFEACGSLLKSAPSDAQYRAMLAALDQGLSETAQTNAVANVTQSLVQQFTPSWKEDIKDELLIRILARLQYSPAQERALRIARDESDLPALRASMLRVYTSTSRSQADYYGKLITDAAPDEVKIAALEAFQKSAQTNPSTLLASYSKFSAPVRSKTREVLLSQKASALFLLKSIEGGQFSAKEIPLEQIRQAALHEDEEINALVRKHWGKIDGAPPEEKLADIRRFNNDLRAFAGDATRGRDLFVNTCAGCHVFFGEGEKVGPDLTHSNRQDRDYLLTSIVDPSVMIRTEYLSYNIETKDGRVLSGLITEQAGDNLTLVSGQKERVTLTRRDISTLQESKVSMMPEGLLHALNPQQLRDLFAYLQHDNPVTVQKAAPKKVSDIKVSKDGKGFVDSSGKPFTPVGFNYDRDYKFRLLEEYWVTEWDTVAQDFKEMKDLGANVIRIHLQFGKFMESPDKANAAALAQLQKLLTLAEKTGLYLDLTGLACYRKADVPEWFDKLPEQQRWTAQAKFWEAIAQTCSKSAAIFCYDLINEPVVPASKGTDWLVGQLAGFYYVQAISLDPAGRTRSEVARQWVSQMARAIRKHDAEHMITVGLLPNSADEEKGSGFVPKVIVPELDFIAMHIYPRSKTIAADLEQLKTFAVGKPVIIEEIFPMYASNSELSDFIHRSRESACGWISFYWGQTREELKAANTINTAITRAWLDTFPQTITSTASTN
jgi:putative membrane-bound dehydrogenase-like protein